MDPERVVHDACLKYQNNPARMIDILWAVQDQLGCIDTRSMQQIADCTGTYRVEVEGVVTFYAFFSTQPLGKLVIRVCEDIVDRHAGMAEILSAFEQALGIKEGQTSADGLFSLHRTPCIGMCDQAPAILINETVITRLTPERVKAIVHALKETPDPKQLITQPGDGNNGHPLVNAMVDNQIRQEGAVLLNDSPTGAGLRTARAMSPAEVLDQIEASGLKGRGGAGFPTAKKWRAAAQTDAQTRYIICNADEGEPGTFKDRVLLTEKPDLLIEGMAIAAHAVGAQHGLIYLRAEYRYLHPYLESVLQQHRASGTLGQGFDIRIQLGAGAYICGEESSLISSCEGKRGEPKNRPPFPVQSGYLGVPTVVNNVETLCTVPRILERGADWFASLGTPASAGTKLLSVSGDCKRPGVYEVPMGLSIQAVLDLAGAPDAEAVQVGGASGQMVGRADFARRLCFEDLPTAGAIVIFSGERSILEIVDYYLHFFIEESCGYCTPCRVGNVFLKKELEKIMKGLGEPSDLTYLKDLGKTIIETSRCGLGHTSPNPVLSTLKSFPLVYAALVKEHPDGLQAGFNIQHALDESRLIAKRRSLIYDPNYDE